MTRFHTTTLGDGRLSRDFEREPEGGSALRATRLLSYEEIVLNISPECAPHEPSYFSVGTCLRKCAPQFAFHVPSFPYPRQGRRW